MPNLPPSTDGRSQFLLCEQVPTVTLDRKTFEELNWSLALALDEISAVRLQEQFVVVARDFVARRRQGAKVLLFLDCWFERAPSQLKSAETALLEARRVLALILAISKLGE
ncbi:hypothetical protein [Microcoleus sp. B3-D7]|uniref:hypothetical protein n=1 Tax=Microcoleus sp. B3-D7 TaxID=2818659 RepID=UPI002FD6A015